MDRDVCGICFDPIDLCKCPQIDIYTHGRWCNHCNFHVDLKTHHETCEFAALKKEVEELRAENHKMREVMMAAYSPRPWVRE